MALTIPAGSASEIRDSAGENRRPKVLSLCCLYPNALQPGQGVFVQRRLQQLGELAEVRVVSPFALVQYGERRGRRFRLGVPAERRDQNVSVLSPRWFYPPLSGSLTAHWLAAELTPRLARLRRSFPFEVIDAHFGHPEGIAGALLSRVLGIPFTMTLRGNEPRHSRSPLEHFWMGWALRRASRIFTVSERLRQFAIEMGAAPDRTKTIPNGVDGTVFFPRDRAAARLKHGLAPHAPLIVSAGALVERKGHHRIMHALHALRAQGSPVEMAIAGGPGPEGEFETHLRSMVKELKLAPAVKFLGPLGPTDLAEVMSAADVFCLASTNEGWPNVVHEALACGTPVVATDVGAIPEMLDGGRNGILVPVNDAELLRKGLEAALHRPFDREAISTWGRARSWRQVAAEVYAELVGVVAQCQKEQPRG